MKQSSILSALLSLLVLILFLATTSSAQTDESGVVSISLEHFQLDIQQIRTITDADTTYLVLEMLLWNRYSSAVEITSDDFLAHVDDLDLQPDGMQAVRDQPDEGWNSPGAEDGLLIDANHADKGLLGFVVPEAPTTITLEFTLEDSPATFTLWLEPLEDGDYRFGLEAIETGTGQVATYTPTPLPTVTPSPTAAGTIWYIANAQNVNVRECASAECNIVEIMAYGTAVTAATPAEVGWQFVTLPDGKQGYINVNYLQQTLPPPASPTLPPTPKPSLGTRYATSTMNLRTCASAECSIAGSLSYGEAFEFTGMAQAADGAMWYSLERNQQEMWAAGWLTSRTHPVAPAAQPQQSTPQGWNCSGNRYDCSDFSSCANMWSYWNACPGDPSHLDGEDNDGRPCEVMCG